VLTTIHGPRYRMLVIGASQLSKYLAQIAISILAEVIAARNHVSLPDILQVEGAKAAREMAASTGSSCDVAPDPT
jgi:xanthine dehydrogenase accessory factor